MIKKVKKRKILSALMALNIFLCTLSPLMSSTVYAQVIEKESTYNNETVNVTSLSTDPNTSHSHIFKTNYDETSHWEECIICGQKKGTKLHNLEVKYTIGEDSCSTANIKIITCKDNCGYNNSSYHTAKEHTKLSSATDRYAYNHYDVCKESWTRYNVESCYTADGKPITYNSPIGSQCAGCGVIYNYHFKVLFYSTQPQCEIVDNGANLSITYTDALLPGYEYGDLKSAAIYVNYNNNNNSPMHVGYYAKSKELIGNNIVTKYVIPFRGSTDKYYYPILIQENKEYINGEYSTIQQNNGGKYTTNLSQPVISSVKLYDSVGNDLTIPNTSEWANSGKIEIKGEIIGSYYCYISLIDEEGNIVFQDKQIAIDDNNQFVYTDSLSEMEADVAGKSYTVIVKDYFGKQTSKTVTAYKLDVKAPILTNKDEISLSDEWAKEKAFNFEFLDDGIGEIQASINTLYSYANAVKKGDKYLKTYTFTGDIYEPKNSIIYYKDALGNYDSTIFAIDKIDNTAPTIVSFEKNTEEVVKSVILSVEANDLNEELGMEGSGDLKYRFWSTDETINKGNAALGVWSSNSYMPIAENGDYYVEVKDALDNQTSSVKISVNNIDNQAPQVQVNLNNSSDGKYKVVTIEAIEPTSGTGYSGLKNNEDGSLVCFSVVNADNKSVEYVVSDTQKDGDKFTKAYAQFKSNENRTFVVRVQDNALNTTLISVSLDTNDISLIDGIDGENLDQLTKFPDWTKGSVNLTAYVNDPSENYNWCWNYKGDLGNYDKTQGNWLEGLYGAYNGVSSSYSRYAVTENGTYTVVAVDKQGNMYNRNIKVENIDNKIPNFSVSVDESYIIIDAADYESGIDYIMVDGGSLETLQQIDCKGVTQTKIAAKISKNGTYKITVYDRAGNSSDTITKEITTSNPDAVFYMVNFCNYDGSIIKSEVVEQGKDATPPAISREGYEFVGWDKVYTNIQEEMNITAVFEKPEEEKYYNVSFYNYNGSVVKSQKVKAGEDATPPTSISREGYIFTGWDKAYTNIQTDESITAIFEKKDGAAIADSRYYNVSFCNYEGSVIKSEKVASGGDATPPTNVTRTGYTFVGWDQAYTNIKGNLTIRAVYTKNDQATTDEAKKYTVTFCNYDGSVLKSQTVKEGEDATAPNSVTREGYIFNGWNKAFSNITENITVSAIFKEASTNQVENKDYYTVNFQNYDGSIVKSEVVEEGKTATPPTVTREGFTFTGWSKSYANVKGQVDTIAKFEKATTKEIAKTSSSGGYSSTGSSSNKTVGDEFEEVKEVEGTVETEDGNILLTEYTDKTIPLGISDEEIKTQVEVKDKSEPKEITLVQEEEIPSTTEAMTTEGGLSAKQVVAIVFLLGCIGAVVFYFLNKKYYWIDLPF